MKFENVSILSVEHVDAPHRVTSQGFEERLEPALSRMNVPTDILRQLSGIMERRWWDEGVKPSDGAAMAGEKAIEASGIDRDQIGILVNTSVCRDFLEPATACFVHNGLGLSETCMNFDVTNACLGFLNGMDVVANMIERGQVDYGLVVDCESSRFTNESTIERLLDPSVDEETFRLNFAALTVGSGAVAMVMARSDKAPDGHRYLGGVNLASTAHCNVCTGNLHEMLTDTKALTVHGLELAIKTWKKAVDELGWDVDTHDQYAQHQVSQAHAQKLNALIGIDWGKIYKLYPDYGNIGPAGIAIVLSKLEKEGLVQSGHRIAMMGIGSGINCMMAEVVW
jgi:3-oxoacyl-[acyl-carrier-protein] synthase III